jgi:CDP-diglyceride synthetase
MNFVALLGEPSFLKGGIRIVHFIGLALGLGTATFLDLLMLRFMVRSKVRPTHVQAFNFGTKIVTAGLVMLWISGLGFLGYYGLFEADKLANPKIWAKLSVVGVLTANAVYLHKVVLPMVEQQVSRPLFAGLSVQQRMLMLVGGATSATCWYVPVALATIPQFNNSIPANQIWACFCALLIAVNAVAVAGLFAGKLVSSRRPAPLNSPIMDELR